MWFDFVSMIQISIFQHDLQSKSPKCYQKEIMLQGKLEYKSNDCSVWIENSVTRVTVRHHETCRVMPNSYPEWRNFQLSKSRDAEQLPLWWNFQFVPNNHYGIFFLAYSSFDSRI